MSNRNNNQDFDFDDMFPEDDEGDRLFEDDEDIPGGFIDEESDMPELEPEGERGTSPVFLLLAGLLIVAAVAILGFILIRALLPTGPTDLELTATQIVLLNQTVEAQLAQTQTQSFIFQQQTQTAAFESLFLTQTALAASPTPSPTNTRLPTLTPTPSPNPDELTATALIANVLTREILSLTPPNLTETAAALTLTALNFTATPSPLPSPTPTLPTDTPSPTIIVTSPLDAVNQTATAIAGAFLTATASAAGVGAPTPETFITAVVTIPLTPIPTALPGTGLLDDIMGGDAGSMGALAVALVGLVGVIAAARHLRSRREDLPPSA
jgi:hypothetical protein